MPRFPKNRYDAYAPLYHLLPAEVLRTTGLPLLKRGLWPNYEREDFERKLHRKRSKVKVIFVEMPDTVPIYAEDTEVHERILWGDFMALLDAKKRRVAICLRRGSVGVVDIAKELGYANHSGVSKALAKIRRKASDCFESD